jgi:YD repeat-containing protein
MSHDYQMFLAGDTTTFTYAELVLGDGGRIRHDRTSAGSSNTDAIMEHTATPTRFYKSRLSWDATRGGWQVLFLDGTLYRFVNSWPAPHLSEIQDRAGNRLTITRTLGTGNHAQVRISRITSPNGRWVDFVYSGTDKIAQIQDHAGRIVTYSYAGGKIIQTDVTNPRGYGRRFTFNAAGRVLTDTPAHGTALAQTTAYTRDATSQRVDSVTDALGRQTTLGYDTNNNVTSLTRLAGTADAVTTTFTYESTFQQLASVTDRSATRRPSAMMAPAI